MRRPSNASKLSETNRCATNKCGDTPKSSHRKPGKMIESWGDRGTVDLLDFLAELTIYTSSSCLLGAEFRAELTPEFATAYRDLEAGTDAFAYVNPYLPLPSFRRRDRARKRLVELIQEIIDRRRREQRDTGDLIQVLTKLRNEDGSPRYSIDQVTGMFISMMFAGHHTTSSTAAWTLIELLQHPGVLGEVVTELDGLYADGRDVSYHALREMPHLEGALKEALRLHPPLILLMRTVQTPFAFRDTLIEAGQDRGGLSGGLESHARIFPQPGTLRPRPVPARREEDKQGFSWLPFGAGRHRCVGAAFAMMQLKAIFSVILQRYDFEMAQPAESYKNDHSKMVVQLQHPCRVRYQRRQARAERPDPRAEGRGVAGPTARTRVKVDLDLCQGHATCVSEAPAVFTLDNATRQVRILRFEVGEEDREGVEAAVRYCPTSALSLEEPE